VGVGGGVSVGDGKVTVTFAKRVPVTSIDCCAEQAVIIKIEKIIEEGKGFFMDASLPIF